MNYACILDILDLHLLAPKALCAKSCKQSTATRKLLTAPATGCSLPLPSAS